MTQILPLGGIVDSAGIVSLRRPKAPCETFEKNNLSPERRCKEIKHFVLTLHTASRRRVDPNRLAQLGDSG